MTDFSATSIPPPKDWQAFERCCRSLFECILGDPHVQLNGRSGQPQNGVDIYGRRGGDGHWVGIQCKGKDGNTYGNKVTEKELRDEVKKALRFSPSLSEFIVVTTAPNDVKIQGAARLITEENKKSGHPMTVVVWGWGELEARIVDYPAALRAFHPDSTPFTDEILSGQSKIETQVDMLLARVKTLGDQLSSVTHYTALGNTIESSDREQSELEAHVHKEIDTYRDLILSGKSKTGMKLLERLKEGIWEKASPRIRFRIITNIGAALLRLGDEEGAAELFLSAIKYDPLDKIGMANVVLAHLLQKDTGRAIESAKNALCQDPENEDAAGYLIQAHFEDPDITDPFSLVPNVLWKRKGVIIGAIAFWRRRGMPDWHKLAHEVAELFPETEDLKRISAEAYLDAICGSKWILLGHNASPNQNLNNLNEVTSVLQSIWDKDKIDEHKIDLSLPYNLAIAYRMLGKPEDAAKTLDEALAIDPDDINLIKLRAICHVSLKQNKDALMLLLDKRGTDPEAAILTAELLLDKDPGKVPDVVSEIDKPGIDEEHRVQGSLIRIESYFREGKRDIALEQARRLSEDNPGKINVIIALSSILRECGDSSAEETLLQAKELIHESTSFVERFLVARELHHWEHYDEAVKIFDGHVDLRRDTPALRLFLLH